MQEAGKSKWGFWGVCNGFEIGHTEVEAFDLIEAIERAIKFLWEEGFKNPHAAIDIKPRDGVVETVLIKGEFYKLVHTRFTEPAEEFATFMNGEFKGDNILKVIAPGQDPVRIIPDDVYWSGRDVIVTVGDAVIRMPGKPPAVENGENVFLLDGMSV